MLSVLLALATAQAGTVALTLRLTEDEAVLIDAVEVPGAPAPTSSAGPLRVLGADGSPLATYPLPDSLRDRSIVYPEGGGAAVRLDASLLRLRVDWPEGAHLVELGTTRLAPRAAPPMPAEVVEVSVSGEPTERLDMLFLGDGYQADELDAFAADVERMSGHLLTVEPYASYSGLVNVWRVDAASNESGGSHEEAEPPVVRDTAYGCAYGCYDIDRLLCCDDGKVVSAINTYLPDADGVMVLVNDPTYGGSGGTTYGTSYVGTYGHQVSSHEIGHSLIGLWDEYSYGYAGGGGDGPNCTADEDGGAWEQWLGTEDVDAFKVCSYTNFYRPTDDGCMMNSLQDQYCPVCREQVVLQIYGRLPSLIVDPDPSEEDVDMAAGEGVTFTARVLGPDDASTQRSWTIEGQEVGTDESYWADGCTDDFELTLTVSDPTDFVRRDTSGLLSDQHTWSVSCEGSAAEGGGDDGSTEEGGDDGGGVGGASDTGGGDEVLRPGCGGCAAPMGAAGAAWLLALGAVGSRRRSFGRAEAQES